MPKENRMFKEITRAQCEGTWTMTLGTPIGTKLERKERPDRRFCHCLSPVKLIFRFSLHCEA